MEAEKTSARTRSIARRLSVDPPRTGRLRHSAIGVGALGILTVVGTLGYMVLESYDLREALFVTVNVLATVGLQVRPALSPGGQALTVVLIVLGLGVVLYTVALVAQQMVEGELTSIFGRRRMQRAIDALHDHVVVCGFGRIGRMVCRELGAKPLPFVVLERDETAAARADEDGCTVILADATEESALTRAGIARARALVTALPSDAENVFITLTARALCPALPVIARAESEAGADRLRQAGATRVVSPYAIGGHRLAQAILRPAVLDFVDLATHHRSLELQLEEIPVGRTDTVPLAESGVREHVDVMIIAIRKPNGEMRFQPSPTESIVAGDCLLAVGEAQSLKALERRLAASA